jgi:hypothetical protein
MKINANEAIEAWSQKEKLLILEQRMGVQMDDKIERGCL